MTQSNHKRRQQQSNATHCPFWWNPSVFGKSFLKRTETMLQYQFLHFTDSCGFLILARHRNRLINRTTQSKYVMKRHSQIQLSLRPGGQYYYVRKFRHSNQFIVETCRTKGIRGCGWALRMGVFGTSRLTQRTTPCRSVGGCRRASLAIGSRCFRCHTYVGSRRQQKKKSPVHLGTYR